MERELLFQHLETMYIEGNTHLREQTTKRDQVLLFYFVMLSFFVSNIPALKAIDSEVLYPLIALVILLVGYTVCLVVIEFRAWHQEYIDALKIINELTLYPENTETNEKLQKFVQKHYFKEFKFDWSLYFQGSDNKIMSIIFLVAGGTSYFFLEPFLKNSKFLLIGIVVGLTVFSFEFFRRRYARRMTKAVKTIPWLLHGFGEIGAKVALKVQEQQKEQETKMNFFEKFFLKRVSSVKKNPYFEVKELTNRKVFLAQKTGGVVILCKLKEEFILIKSQRNGQIFTECPRGFAENNEDLKSAAEREITEELGIKSEQILKTSLLGRLRTDTGLIEDQIEAYLVELDSLIGNHPQTGEGVTSIERYTWSELENNINSGDITDNFTLSALFLYKLKIT